MRVQAIRREVLHLSCRVSSHVDLFQVPPQDFLNQSLQRGGVSMAEQVDRVHVGGAGGDLVGLANRSVDSMY